MDDARLPEKAGAFFLPLQARMADPVYAALREQCAQAAAFYNGAAFAPGLPCDGPLTLSERIANPGAPA